jgi:outer membrane protein assembly factor BamB
MREGKPTMGKVLKAARILGWLGVLGVLAVFAQAADWPQWRGPNRDAISSETGLLQTWPAQGPPLLWTYNDAGQGFSSPSILGERLFIMGARGDGEYVLALDVKSGKELWHTKIGPTFTWEGNSWNAGPSASPTVDGDLVFGLGGQGVLVCVEAANGKERWRKDLPKELGAEVNPVGGGPEKLGWGYAWSPLVDGPNLICVPGGPQGTVAALDKTNGKVLWRSKELTEQATYASPIATEAGGVRQYVILTQNGPAGVAAKDGKLLWFTKREEPYPDIVAPTPIVKGNNVYVSVGYGGGCELLKLTPDGDKLKAEQVYSQKAIATCLGGVVLVGEHVYGFNEKPPRGGWQCQNFQTGEIAWTSDGRRGFPSGSVIYADGRLYCLSENSLVALLEASPRGYKEAGRFKLPQESKLRKPSGKTWTHPVLANGRLYLRDQELLFCFDVKVR